MDRKKAQAVLKAVEKKYEQWITMSREDFGQTHPDEFPQLMENYNWRGTGRPAPFAIVWESNSPDEWAGRWGGEINHKDPEGTFCEPIMSFILGIYDDGAFEWNRAKRGAKFVHQHLITEDRKPERCWITKISKVNSQVWYRVGDPKTGFLNTCTFEYFEDHVVSFWED